MPNGGTLPERVTGAEVRIADLDAMVDRRVGTVEARLRELRGAEEEHESMTARITALEAASREHESSERGRRDRIWVLGLAVMSGLVLPLLTTAVIAFLHIRSSH